MVKSPESEPAAVDGKVEDLAEFLNPGTSEVAPVTPKTDNEARLIRAENRVKAVEAARDEVRHTQVPGATDADVWGAHKEHAAAYGLVEVEREEAAAEAAKAVEPKKPWYERAGDAVSRFITR